MVKLKLMVLYHICVTYLHMEHILVVPLLFLRSGILVLHIVFRNRDINQRVASIGSLPLSGPLRVASLTSLLFNFYLFFRIMIHQNNSELSVVLIIVKKLIHMNSSVELNSILNILDTTIFRNLLIMI